MVELIHTHKGTVYAQRNGTLIPVNTDGLVGYWPMTQGSGLTAYDESKNGNNGTLNNGPVWTDTANGKALDFDGVDDYIEVSDDASLDITNAITLSGWINSNLHRSGYQHIIGKASAYILKFEQSGTDYPRFQLLDSGNTWHTFEYSTALSTNQWIHLVATWNGTQMRMYIDGQEVGTPVSFSGTLNTTNNDVFLGAYNLTHIDFDGTIDEVRIYDRALSAQEITNIYEKTRGLYSV